MNSGAKHEQDTEEGKSHELNLKLKYYDIKRIESKDKLLKDMASKIQSYMCSFKPNQAGYDEGKKLIDRYNEQR